MTDRSFNKFSKSDQMMMFSKDVKPGNGQTLLSYQNHQSLKRHINDSVHLVDDRASDFYINWHATQPERYEHEMNKQQNLLRKENTRLFGRLVDILDKKIDLGPDHAPGSLSVLKNKLANQKMRYENQVIGNTIMTMKSIVPDQERLKKINEK